jgi:glycosyltransferase involved in cell wall biosynthesis
VSGEEKSAGKPPPEHILWEGTQFALHSFAQVNREICSELIAADVAEISLVPYEPDQFAPDGDPKLERLRSHDIRVKGLHLRERALRPHIWIRHQFPPRPAPPPGGDKWVIMQPWEYSAAPKSLIDVLAKADEVWTPSHFSRAALVRSGLPESKVHVIPNGIDPRVFTARGAALPLPTKKPFKFLYVGGTIYRKGIDLLLEAYSKAFSAADDVCLVIKDFGKQALYKGQTADKRIQAYRERDNAPEILYLDQDLSQADLASLYRACDVCVAPYRGEGFSLPTLEAMASGIPVVVTKGGSTDDFVDATVGWQIDATPKSIGDKVYGQPLGQEGFLLEPDQEQLTGVLGRLPAARSELAERGVAASHRAHSQWTWRHAAIKVLKRVDAICGTAAASKVPSSPTSPPGP